MFAWRKSWGRLGGEGATGLFLAEALMLPTGLVTAMYLARHLAPADYGRFVLCAVIVGWLEWTITGLLGRASVVFVGEAEDWSAVATAVIRLYLAFGTVAMIGLLLATPLIARGLGEPRLSALLPWFALDLPIFSLAQAHHQVLLARGLVPARSLAGAGRWLARMTLILALVALGLSARGAVLGAVGASVVEVCLARRAARPSLLTPTTFPTARLLRFARPLFLFALLLRLHDSLDLLVLKLMGASAAQAGVYGAAENLCTAPGLAAMALSSVLLARLTQRKRRGDLAGAHGAIHGALRVPLLLLPLPAVIAGAPLEVSRLVLGSPFDGAAPLLAPLLIGAVALIVVAIASAVLTAGGRPGWTVAIAAPVLTVAVTGYLAWIPALGGIGAARANAAGSVVGAIVACCLLRAIENASLSMATVARCGSAALACYTITRAIPLMGWGVLVKLAGLAALVVAFYFLTGEFAALPFAPSREEPILLTPDAR